MLACNESGGLKMIVYFCYYRYPNPADIPPMQQMQQQQQAWYNSVVHTITGMDHERQPFCHIAFEIIFLLVSRCLICHEVKSDRNVMLSLSQVAPVSRQSCCNSTSNIKTNRDTEVRISLGKWSFFVFAFFFGGVVRR